MTIIALHHTDQEMFAIADGLISRGPERVIAEDQKIVIFKPRYQIPHARLGHFDGFSEYSGVEFGLAYAGTYAIIATVIKRFMDIVTRSLFIDRDYEKGGRPTIFHMTDPYGRFRSGSYGDSYNFSSDELLPITVNFLMNILEKVCAKACADFHLNAMTRPDAHFAIFGTDKVGHNEVTRCQIIKCLDVIHGEMQRERFSALPWSLNCIGDLTVIPDLMSLIEAKEEYALPPFVPAAPPSDFTFLGVDDSTKFDSWARKESVQSLWRRKRESIIEAEVMRLIAKGTRTIGGDCTIAQSGWARVLTIRTIRNVDVCERFNAESD